MSPNAIETGSLGVGAVAGVVSYVFGYAITFVLKAGGAQSRFYSALLAAFRQPTVTADQLGITSPSMATVVGWEFYEAHNVGTVGSVDAGGFSTWGAGPSLGSDPLLLLVPPLLLTTAGVLLAARKMDSGGIPPLLGISVILGYLPLTVVGTFLFTWSSGVHVGYFGATVSMGPSLALAVVIMGLLYPLLFGGLGGILALKLGVSLGSD